MLGDVDYYLQLELMLRLMGYWWTVMRVTGCCARRKEAGIFNVNFALQMHYCANKVATDVKQRSFSVCFVVYLSNTFA